MKTPKIVAYAVLLGMLVVATGCAGTAFRIDYRDGKLTAEGSMSVVAK